MTRLLVGIGVFAILAAAALGIAILLAVVLTLYLVFDRA